MKEIIAVSNQKGGVGKSTTASAVGAYLFHKGFKVLYVDLDPQMDLSFSTGVTSADISSLEVLKGTATARQAIIKTKQGDIIPSSHALASADAINGKYNLKEALTPILGDYDYIVIDTPPALGTFTINALTACNSIIIPAQADVYSLRGIGQLIQTIQTVQTYCNKDLSIKGLLLTRYNARAVLTKDMAELLQDTATRLHTKLFTAKIRECIAIKESQVQQQDIFTYAPKSNASADYTAFMEELLRD